MVLAVAIVAVVPWSLYLRVPGSSYSGELPPLTSEQNSLAIALRSDVEHLATHIGERNLGRRPEALEQAAAWIEQSLRDAGYEPSRHTYQIPAGTAVNIDAQKTGREEGIVLVGAHYDSPEGSPGANDNGSGVAATLAMARAFAQRDLRRSVRFVFFTNEEPPYFATNRMGSAVYADRCHARGDRIVAMISFETLGYYTDAPGSQKYPPPLSLLYPERGNFVAFVSSTESRSLVRDVTGMFRSQGAFPSEGVSPPAQVPGVSWSDHAPFEKVGYAGLMVTDTAPFRYPHYHKPTDTPDQLTYDRYARVVSGMMRVVETLANR